MKPRLTNIYSNPLFAVTHNTDLDNNVRDTNVDDSAIKDTLRLLLDPYNLEELEWWEVILFCLTVDWMLMDPRQTIVAASEDLLIWTFKILGAEFLDAFGNDSFSLSALQSFLRDPASGRNEFLINNRFPRLTLQEKEVYPPARIESLIEHAFRGYTNIFSTMLKLGVEVHFICRKRLYGSLAICDTPTSRALTSPSSLLALRHALQICNTDLNDFVNQELQFAPLRDLGWTPFSLSRILSSNYTLKFEKDVFERLEVDLMLQRPFRSHGDLFKREMVWNWHLELLRAELVELNEPLELSMSWKAPSDVLGRLRDLDLLHDDELAKRISLLERCEDLIKREIDKQAREDLTRVDPQQDIGNSDVEPQVRPRLVSCGPCLRKSCKHLE